MNIRVVSLGVSAAVLAAATVYAQAEARATLAVEYLVVEVPRWARENHCFSCHNNGDGARVLYVAARLGYLVPDAALADTAKWLLEPGKWDNNGGNPGFSDKKLARIQFAAALSEAYASGTIPGRALREAAASLLPYQEADGSWQVDAGAVGSPATYGTSLATCMARLTLEKADGAAFKDAIARADRWLLQNKPRSLIDAAAALLALPGSEAVKRRSLDFILPAQSSDGGWGPHPLAASEPFDTAVVLLALRKLDQPERTRGPIARGRSFLLAQQQPGGGWPETTRPPGAQSYAQHISTSAWATLALILTRE